ncbi:MAG: group-specific protein [Patescibacteria group bacterium]|nr:group-specific protein [Patescibacteria group bacterium]
MEYVYHRIPPNMEGPILYTLNALRLVNPEAYDLHVNKYEGREKVLDIRIPTLDCMWNDVIFMSPVHPNQYQEVYDRFNYTPFGTRFYKIPVEMLDHELTRIYVHPPKKEWHSIAPEHLEEFSPESVRRHSMLPKETITYFEERLGNGLNFLVNYKVPHVLYKGNLDVTGLEIISIGTKETVLD